MKAMCEERLVDWHSRFKSVGLSCISVTGDSDFVDIKDLNYHNVIITTPEKWDSITRRWKDNQQLVQSIKLFLIDEVHLLNEDCRGSTLEAVVSFFICPRFALFFGCSCNRWHHSHLRYYRLAG